MMLHGYAVVGGCIRKKIICKDIQHFSISYMTQLSKTKTSFNSIQSIIIYSMFTKTAKTIQPRINFFLKRATTKKRRKS